MVKEYTLIRPDIDPGRGRTGQVVDELIRLWQEGKNEGASEIAALASLLVENKSISNIFFRLGETGPATVLAREFIDFLVEDTGGKPKFPTRVMRDRGLTRLPLCATCAGSATGALYAALCVAGVAGGEVITTSFNYMGIPNAIVMAGAIPRFVDIDEKNWCMDHRSAARAVTKKTRAIVLTHVNQFADVEPYYDLLMKKGFDIALIQDASLAIGSTLNGLRPGIVNMGSFGATIYSLAVSKIISGLGGAFLIAQDNEVIRHIQAIFYQGVDLCTDSTDLLTFGANFKMSDLNAVIALEQLRRRGEIFKRRLWLKSVYDQRLDALIKKGSIVLQDVAEGTIMTHYGVLLPDRKTLSGKLLRNHNIQTGMWFCHHLQPIYKDYLGEKIKPLPMTESLSNRIAFLPFHTGLGERDVDFICSALEGEIEDL